jgi:lipopolysaccharide/colanic/teichoic acid biosynthesis glycosyltransferase
MVKRLFDIFFSLIALIIMLPFFIFISIFIKLGSAGPVFYTQQRVGKNNRDFKLWKFRSMKTGSDKKGLITIGDDIRVTGTGRFLRKYKLDELPQLLNIIGGDMSIVGPRPEVRKYVDLYNQEQLRVLSVKPGLTDYASLKYFNESEILKQYEDANKAYIEIIMPAKLKLNLEYIDDKKFGKDIGIILKTILRILS